MVDGATTQSGSLAQPPLLCLQRGTAAIPSLTFQHPGLEKNVQKRHKMRVTYAPAGLVAPRPFLWMVGLAEREGERELDSLSDRPNNSRHGRAMLWTDSYTRSLAPTSLPESTPAGLTITSASEMAQSETRGEEGGSCEGWTDAYMWASLDIRVLTGVQSDDRNRKGSCSNVTCSCKNLKKCVSMCFTQKGSQMEDKGMRLTDKGWSFRARGLLRGGKKRLSAG